MGYGIGRVPADVDPNDEAMAELEAAEIMARQSRPDGRPRTPSGAKYAGGCTHHDFQPDGTYTVCDAQILCPRAVDAHLMGCMVLCEQHLERYFAGFGTTIDGEIARECALAEEERRNPPRCRECGRRPATWISGAGGYLCRRHADTY